MQKLLRTLPMILILTGIAMYYLLSTRVDASPNASTIHWRNYTDSAFATAAKSNKLIFLYGHANWCHFCQNMDANTLSDPAVIQLLNKKFIAISIDVDVDISLVRKYAISSLPTIIIMNPNKDIVKRFAGYMTANELVEALE